MRGARSLLRAALTALGNLSLKPPPGPCLPLGVHMSRERGIEPRGNARLTFDWKVPEDLGPLDADQAEAWASGWTRLQGQGDRADVDRA